MNLIQTIDLARNLLNEPLSACRTFPDNTSSFYTDSTLITYFNVIQDDLQNEIISEDEAFFETATYLSITDGCATYDLPSGTIKIKRVEDTRGNGQPTEIRPVTLNDKNTYSSLDIRCATFQGGGYYLVGETITLTQTPTFGGTAAIRITYSRDLADVSAATAISSIPPQHHQTIAWGIVRYALVQGQTNTDFGDRINREYEKRLKRLREFISKRQVQRPRQVKVMSGDTTQYNRGY